MYQRVRTVSMLLRSSGIDYITHAFGSVDVEWFLSPTLLCMAIEAIAHFPIRPNQCAQIANIARVI